MSSYIEKEDILAVINDVFTQRFESTDFRFEKRRNDMLEKFISENIGVNMLAGPKGTFLYYWGGRVDVKRWRKYHDAVKAQYDTAAPCLYDNSFLTAVYAELDALKLLIDNAPQ